MSCAREYGWGGTGGESLPIELAKTVEEKDRLGKAKDRLDTRTAAIGQQLLEDAAEAVQPEGEISPPTSDIDGGQFSQSRMGNEEATGLLPYPRRSCRTYLQHHPHPKSVSD